jgi:hypothetical protein
VPGTLFIANGDVGNEPWFFYRCGLLTECFGSTTSHQFVATGIFTRRADAALAICTLNTPPCS